MQCVLLQGLCDSKSPRVFSSDNQVGDRGDRDRDPVAVLASSSSSRGSIASEVPMATATTSARLSSRRSCCRWVARTHPSTTILAVALRAAAGADSHEKEADGGDRGTSGGAGAGDESWVGNTLGRSSPFFFFFPSFFFLFSPFPPPVLPLFPPPSFSSWTSHVQTHSIVQKCNAALVFTS